LSSTVRHGSSTGDWNTTAASGEGPQQRSAVELDRSRAGGQQSGEQLEQRRLSATALADDRDELAVEDLEVEVF
jgi:hypothetical protein